MPSLPTSLILAGLVIAWLVVLVPMVARRREQVPKNDAESAHFRVLDDTDKARPRRRPVLSRTAMTRSEEATVVAADVSDDAADDVPAHAAADAASDLADDAASDLADNAVSGETTRYDAVLGDSSPDDSDTAEADNTATVVDVTTSQGAPASQDTGDDAPVDEHYGHRRWTELNGETYSAATSSDDPDRHRPVSPRRGRGGYDPAAAAATTRDRFQQRRRVALVLLIVTLLGVGAGVLHLTGGWTAAVAAGTMLVLYLAYLRRQVRIEAELRQRRERRHARGAQQRLYRHGARPSVAEQVWQHRTGEMPGPGDDVAAGLRVSSHAHPPAGMTPHGVPGPGRLPGELVELDDSDPAFDDLDDVAVLRPARRRAS